jgi:hypothetical protein
VDLSRMVEGVQNGTLIQDVSLRNRFFSTMIQANGVSSALEALIQQEADSVGKGSIVDEFVAATDYKGKGGSYGSSVTAGFGRIVLPFDSDESKPVAFSYGHFLNCSGCTKDADLDGSYKAAADREVPRGRARGAEGLVAPTRPASLSRRCRQA